MATVENCALAGRDSSLRDKELDPGRLALDLHHCRRGLSPVADLDLGLEGTVRRGLARHPREPIGHQTAASEQLLRPHNHLVPHGIDVQHVVRLTGGDTETAPLPDRVPERPAMVSQDAALRVHHLALADESRHELLEERRVSAAGDKADLLRVRLRGDGSKSEPGRLRPRFDLRQSSEREESPRQLPLAQHVEHVRLVLCSVGALEQPPPPAGGALRSRVVPGRDEPAVQLIRVSEERAELDVLVASDTWVRCPTGFVLGEEIGDDRLLELLRDVVDLEGHSEGCGYGARVFARAVAAASAFRPAVREMDELHVRPHDLVALLKEQARRDGGINPAGHADQHPPLAHRSEASTAHQPVRRSRLPPTVSYGGMGSFGGVMTMSKMPSRMLVGAAVFELVLAAGFGVLAVVLPAEARPGMIITAVILGVVGIVLLAIRRRAATRFAETERLRSSGLDGTATIVELSQTNMYMNGQPQVAMGLQVTFPGREPYTVQLKEFVPLIFLGALTAGVPLPVKVDPANLQKVLIDWQHVGAAPAGGPGPTQQVVAGKDVAATPELVRQSASAGMLPSESELEYQRTRLRQFGKPATAVVQSAQDTGMTVGRYKVFSCGPGPHGRGSDQRHHGERGGGSARIRR